MPVWFSPAFTTIVIALCLWAGHREFNKGQKRF